MKWSTEEDIAQIVASWTGVPVKKMTEDESERLLHMEELLHKRVVGQDEGHQCGQPRASPCFAQGFRTPSAPSAPSSSLGPRAWAKTELCRALGEVMFDDENAVIRIDMSEYMEKHSVSRLVGSPAGLRGLRGGRASSPRRCATSPTAWCSLTRWKRRNRDVFNILLQILDDGRLTDSNGRVVNFKKHHHRHDLQRRLPAPSPPSARWASAAAWKPPATMRP